MITLRTAVWHVVPGEVLTVSPRRQWSYAGHPYLSGDIESMRLDVPALGLIPLKLEDRGPWNPDEEYWGEEGKPIDAWARPIIARGPRPSYEMEQVLPGWDPKDFDSDPITDSNDLKDAGDHAGARKILMGMCRADLRCLDAHAHLGNLVFESTPEDALRHYQAGAGIGALSLGSDFGGVLAWGCIDNRPFLRCMHGLGLCLWRLKRLDEAERIFNQMLWLNPSDNQGARLLIADLRARLSWEECKNK